MALARGFPDPVHDAQGVFRAVMDALTRPGSLQPIATALRPPAPLTPQLAAVALALADADTPLWLDAGLRSPEIKEFLRFHTGAPLADDPAEAVFALIGEPARCRPFADFAQGSPDYPDRSTTLVLALDRLAPDGTLLLAGPGIRGTARLGADPLPADIAGRWADNRARFPRGVDLLLAGPGLIAGLPRSVRVSEMQEA